jgi:hypothetical protein
VQTGVTASSLPSGNYSFKVTDNVGCVRTGTVVIPPVTTISASFGVTAAACRASTGAISVSPTGGATPYTFSWSTGSSSSSISSLAGGVYGITITDNNGCSLFKNVFVPVTSPISIGITSSVASCIYTADGSLTARPTGGTSPYTYIWSSGATTATNSGLLTGRYIVNATDAAGCIAATYVDLGYNTAADYCYCTIKGKVYFDANGNCTLDFGEPGIQNVQMKCTGYGYNYTDSGGNYSFKVPTGSYTILQSILHTYPLAACQAPSVSVSVTAASGCVNTINFADTLNPLHDMHISTWDYNYAVPGDNYYQTVIVSNEGTVTESNILSGYQTDGQLFSPTVVPSSVYGLGGGN